MAGMRRLIVWWQSLPLPWRVWRVVGQVGAGDGVPDRLPNKGVVLIGAPGGEARPGPPSTALAGLGTG